MAIVCVGVDLAKNVFAIHGVDDVGKAVWVQPRVPRAQLLAAFSNLPPCLIGMEACSGAHHWARQLLAMGRNSTLASRALADTDDLLAARCEWSVVPASVPLRDTQPGCGQQCVELVHFSKSACDVRPAHLLTIIV
jgi:hypothetical protein